MPGSWRIKSLAGASGPTEVLKGPVKASKGPDLFDSKGSVWFSLSDLFNESPVVALEAQPLCIKQSRPLTKVIFFKQAG